MENELNEKNKQISDEQEAKAALFHKTEILQRKLFNYESNGNDTINSISENQTITTSNQNLLQKYLFINKIVLLMIIK